MFGLVPVFASATTFGTLPSLVALATSPLASLRPLDLIVIAVYFAMVVWIGFYLKGKSNTSEEFFMAGREMTAWIAGLSFVSANMGSLELMGWAGSAYQYGILATHWYWIGAIPAMLFLGLVMMPFYYVSKTHSVPGYLDLRYDGRARSVAAVAFAAEMILMSGVNMFAMAIVMKVVLGWDINFSIIVSSVAVALYVGLGGLRSAIFNEVLQFVLIWGGALLVPILGLVQAGRLERAQSQDPDESQQRQLFSSLARHGQVLCQPDGCALDRHRIRAGLCDQLRLLDNGLPGGAAGAGGAQFASGSHGADHRFILQDGCALHRDSCRVCLDLCCCKIRTDRCAGLWAKTLWRPVRRARRGLPRAIWRVRRRCTRPTCPRSISRKFWQERLKPSCTPTIKRCR